MPEDKTCVSSGCPNCNDFRIDPVLRAELLKWLDISRPIDCKCAACNEPRPVTEAERAALARELS
jgi:hypothetical protein